MATARGRFLWHELMCDDPSAAIDFYSKIIGWEEQPSADMAGYHLLAWKGMPMAGVMKTPGDAARMGARASWTPYFGTNDAQVTAWDAQRLGGKLLKEPTTTPGVGTWAVLQDPQGATFAILQPEREPRPMAEPGLGDFSWHELATTDHKGAFDFYRTLFGWDRTSSFDMGAPMGEYLMFGPGKVESGGMYTKGADQPGPAAWASYIRVKDVDAVSEQAKKNGGTLMFGPMDVPGGDRVAMASDPQGAVFALHARKAVAKSSVAKKKKPAKKKATKKKVTKRTAKPAKRAKSSARKKPAKKKSKRR